MLQALTVGVLLLAVHFYRPAAGGLWTGALYDAVHAPVFGIVAVCLYGLFGRLGRLSARARFAAALAAAVLLAIASELAQIPTERDASLHDLATNWLGSAGFLLIAAGWPGSGTRRWSRVPALLGSAALAVALLPFLKVSAAYVERNISVPLLVEPGFLLGDEFWRPQNASVTVRRFDRRPAFRVDLGGGSWPGMIFHDIWPRWGDYATLELELGNAEEQPLDVHLRIHDLRHRRGEQPYSDRFNTTLRLPPGSTTVRIPLSMIREAPNGRNMDLDSVDGLVLFCDSSSAGRSFYLMGIELK